MDQFDQENLHEGEPPPTPVVSAAEELRSTVERQLSQIVEAAETRAAEIENRALENASHIEREADRRAVDALDVSIERARRTLTAIDAFEHEIGETVGSLRREVERLHTELRAAREQPAWSAPPAEQATQGEAEEPVEAFGAAINSLPFVVREGAPEQDSDGPETIRQLLVRLAQRGTPRADAERFLARYEQADEYLPILDEVYSAHNLDPNPSRRRSLLRRHK